MKNKIILTLIFILLIGSSAFAAGTFYFGGKKQTLSGSTVEVQAGYYDHQLLTSVFTGLTPENLKAGVTIGGITGTYNNITNIGAAYGGGIVFYLGPTGQTGLIAATSDQSTSTAWSNVVDTLIGTTGTAIGSGESNTLAIISQPGHIASAASICNDLVLNGYSDWFLPSKDELSAMYTNLKAFGLGGFTNGYYWSSFEYLANEAGTMSFNDGSYLGDTKSHLRYVRAIRKF